MTKEFFDMLQSITPYAQKIQTTMMIMQKEGIKLKDVNISEDEIINIETGLNTIKLLDERFIKILKDKFKE